MKNACKFRKKNWKRSNENLIRIFKEGLQEVKSPRSEFELK